MLIRQLSTFKVNAIINFLPLFIGEIKPTTYHPLSLFRGVRAHLAPKANLRGWQLKTSHLEQFITHFLYCYSINIINFVLLSFYLMISLWHSCIVSTIQYYTSHFLTPLHSRIASLLAFSALSSPQPYSLYDSVSNRKWGTGESAVRVRTTIESSKLGERERIDGGLMYEYVEVGICTKPGTTENRHVRVQERDWKLRRTTILTLTETHTSCAHIGKVMSGDWGRAVAMCVTVMPRNCLSVGQ